VGTVAFGGAMTMAGLLLASGAKGKRAVLPNTKMMLHMPSGVARGQVSLSTQPITPSLRRFSGVLIDRVCLSHGRFYSADAAVQPWIGKSRS
jgi:ATP-dependent Clp protease protease subunit